MPKLYQGNHKTGQQGPVSGGERVLCSGGCADLDGLECTGGCGCCLAVSN